MNLDTKTHTDSNGKVMMYACPSNVSPASEQYKKLVQERVDKIKAAHPKKKGMFLFRKILLPVPAAGLTPIFLPRRRSIRRNGSPG